MTFGASNQLTRCGPEDRLRDVRFAAITPLSRRRNADACVMRVLSVNGSRSGKSSGAVCVSVSALEAKGR